MLAVFALNLVVVACAASVWVFPAVLAIVADEGWLLDSCGVRCFVIVCVVIPVCVSDGVV